MKGVGATIGVNGRISEGKIKEIAKSYDFQGYKRLYLVHIRKTGGTSLNNMFLSLAGGDSQALYSQLATTPSHRSIRNGLIFVGWDVSHINRGNYFYGFSHTPYHELTLPEKTFTITCLRDPIERVLSHYNMLTHYRRSNVLHPCMAVEGAWLGEDIDHFLERLPRKFLLAQLYMFSKRYDVDEALANVQQVSHCLFSDSFDSGITEINRKTGLHLKPLHMRKADLPAQVSARKLKKLREMLAEEYALIERVRAWSHTLS
jgi:hypothetical protein